MEFSHSLPSIVVPPHLGHPPLVTLLDTARLLRRLSDVHVGVPHVVDTGCCGALDEPLKGRGVGRVEDQLAFVVREWLETDLLGEVLPLNGVDSGLFLSDTRPPYPGQPA